MTATPHTNGHVFDAREKVVEAEKEYPPFPFIGLDGLQYELPHPLLLSTGQQAAVIEAQAEGDSNRVELAMSSMLAEVAPEAFAAMMEFPAVVTAQLLEAWQTKAQESMGDEMGNGSGRPSQPNRAARRSRPTSSSKGSTSTTSPSTT